MKEKEPLEVLEEWQEHQYNPGYWAGGKFRLGFPPKRAKGMWLFSFIDLAVSAISFLLFSILFIIERETYFLIPLGVFGIILILSILRTRRFKPEYKSPPQEELEEIRHKESQKEKRRKANRRKDYH